MLFRIAKYVFRRGFRLCGDDQRAFRSPFGNLRCLPCLLILTERLLVSVPFVPPCNMKNQAAWEAKAKGSRGRPQSPLVASAEAKFPAKQHKTVRKTAFTEYKNSINKDPLRSKQNRSTRFCARRGSFCHRIDAPVTPCRFDRAATCPACRLFADTVVRFLSAWQSAEADAAIPAPEWRLESVLPAFRPAETPPFSPR